MPPAALGALSPSRLLRTPPCCRARQRCGFAQLPRCAAPAPAPGASARANSWDGLPRPQLVHATEAPVPPETWDNAALLVDKPTGWTSHDVCAKLKGALRLKKIGHAGTLDPLATGLLIVCTGRGTKWVDFFMAKEKGYTGVLRLGEATPSYDSETEVSARSAWQHLSDDDIRRAAGAFVGDIMQEPPMFSALKKDGVPLYVKARAGVEVARAARQLHIARFDVWRDSPSSPDVHFAVECSKGTYIRSLAHDLGAALGTHAHLVALRRTSIGEHLVANAWSLDALVTNARAQRTLA